MTWSHGTFLVVSIALAAGLRAATAAKSLAAPATEQVGEWSDPARIEFAGLKTFQAADVLRALRRHAPFLLASHPLAPRSGLLPAIEEHVRAGYLAAGFAEARVIARYDGGARRIRVTVTEGRRLVAGEIRIRGSAGIPVAEVVRRLTTAWPPETITASVFTPDAVQPLEPAFVDSSGQPVGRIDAIWTVGQPMDFSPAQLERIRIRLGQVLADCGYHGTLFTAKLHPLPTAGRVELHVDIVGEGQAGRIGRINIQGLKRHSPETVLRWLGLERGRPLTPDFVSRLERRLWDSARFATYRITPAGRVSAAGEVDFDLALTEIEHGPLLGEEFSAEEKAMLKFRDWLVAAFAANAIADVVLPLGHVLEQQPELAGLEMILGQQGMIGVIRQEGVIRSALLLAPDRRLYFSSDTARKLETTEPGGTLNVFLSVLPAVQADGDIRTNIMFGAHWSSRAAGQAAAAPFKFDLLIAPAAFLNAHHKSDKPTRLMGDRLVIGDEQSGVHVEAATGRLISLGAGRRPGAHVIPRVEAGVFERTRRDIEAAAKTTPNLLSPEHPASTFLAATGAELIAGNYLQAFFPSSLTAGQRRRAAAAFQKLCAYRPLAVLDAAWAEKKGAHSFHIPFDAGSGAAAGIAPFIPLLMPMAEALVPAQAWPGLLMRELLIATNASAPYLAATVDAVVNSADGGPVACLLATKLLAMTGQPSAPTMAQHGLARLSAADFRRDCRLLFEGDSGISRAVHALAQGLRELSSDEVDDLAASFESETAAQVRAAWAALRARPREPLSTVLQPLLDSIWERYLRARVEASLRAAAGPAANAAEAERLFQAGMKPFNEAASAPADRAHGAQWLRQSAELGHARAAFALAQLHAHGEGVARDAAASLEWHRRAAQAGILESQIVLGNAYHLGLDVAADPVEACFWYSVAAANGHKPAESLRNVARRQLSTDQAATLERRLAGLKTPGPPTAPAAK